MSKDPEFGVGGERPALALPSCCHGYPSQHVQTRLKSLAELDSLAEVHNTNNSG
jgi:hypothetical protein